MALIGYGGIMGDPDFLRRRFSSKSTGRSFSRVHGYKNSEFDNLADKQLTTIDPEKRKELVVKMQELLADDVPVIPLYVPTRIALFNAKVFDGWYYTPGCSPCRATRNKHMFVTGKKTGL
jgi:peptide/nickel transport system substrate-binding protein